MTLRLTSPESEEDQQKVLNESQRYAGVIGYLASWCEQRSAMGDMTTRQVMDEVERNVCIVMRRDCINEEKI